MAPEFWGEIPAIGLEPELDRLIRRTATPLMIRYSLRFLWIASRGYRWRPWRSPYLRWRIETFSGIPAEEVTFSAFWGFLWRERRQLLRFLQWGDQMTKLEKQLRKEADATAPRAR